MVDALKETPDCELDRDNRINRFYRERIHWQDHIKAAITDLRNSDRSPFEQQVYDTLRVFADQHLKE